MMDATLKRWHFVDHCKAIAIICVVLGHLPVMRESFFNAYMGGFRIPLFFSLGFSI